MKEQDMKLFLTSSETDEGLEELIPFLNGEIIRFCWAIRCRKVISY